MLYCHVVLFHSASHPSDPRAMLFCEISREPPSTRHRVIMHHPHPPPHPGSGSEAATGMVLKLMVKMLVRVLFSQCCLWLHLYLREISCWPSSSGCCHGGGTGEGALQGPAGFHQAALANRGFRSRSRSPLTSSMDADAVRAKNYQSFSG